MSGLKHLPDEEQARLRAALADAEARTRAHFALVIVPLSERYLLFAPLWAAGVAFLAGGILVALFPHWHPAILIAAQAAIFAGLALTFDLRPLRLLLVPRRVKHMAARTLAHREFASRILADRAHRNGMLFFVSLGERYVEVIADPELHARVGNGAWEEIVATFTASAKEGRIADGFITGIETCARLLEQHYPRD